MYWDYIDLVSVIFGNVDCTIYITHSICGMYLVYGKIKRKKMADVELNIYSE